MHKQLLIFLSLAFCSNRLHIGADSEGECSGCPDALNKWLKMSEWSSNRPSLRENFAMAAYRRSQNAASNSSNFYTSRTRLLFQGGEISHGSFSDSWIYSPGINSWALVTPPSDLGLRSGHSLTTLCETRVILFGGNRSLEQNVWLFDGTREEWLLLSFSPLLPSPAGLTKHSASAVWREESPCQCKESLFIYGGRNNNTNVYETDNLWEMYCVHDTDENNMTYRWKFLGNSATSDTYWAPKLSEHLSFTIKTDLFLLGNNHTCDTSKRFCLIDKSGVWKLDTLTLTWSHYDNFSTVILSRFQPSSGTYLKELGLVLMANGSKAFTYDVQAKQQTILTLTSDTETGVSLPQSDAPTAISVEKNVFMFAKKCFDSGCETFPAAWTVELDSAKNESNATDLTLTSLTSPRLSPSTTDCFNTDSPPIVYGIGSSLLFKCTSDAATKLGCGHSFEGPLWQLDFDSKRWMLYTPDQQIPFHLGASSVFDSDSLVVFMGLWIDKGGIYNITNELWVYTVSRRVWNQVQQPETGPKGHIYASLTPMKNGSLILYGSFEDTCCGQAEFWILNLNLTTLSATWYRPRHHCNQSILCNACINANNFYGHSSTYAKVVNDYLFVYGGLSNKSTGDPCNSDIFYVNVTNPNSPWKRFTSIDGGCVVASERIGSYIFIALRNSSRYISLKKFDSVEAEENTTLITAEPSAKMFGFLVVLKNYLFTVRMSHEYPIRYQPFLYSFQLGCLPGTNSSDISLYSCQKCPKNDYCKAVGSKESTHCPPHLVTPSSGSTSEENCTCPDNWCSHGKCKLNPDYSIFCQCHFGYNGERCQTPILLIISSGSLAAVLLVIATVYCIKKIRRHRKMAISKNEQLQRAQMELDQAEKTVTKLSNIWAVNHEEVVFKKTIGQGSYGIVWSAEYRNQVVAVKVLKISADDCTNEQLRDFNDESELLQSICHGNIVRFIGTGKTTGDNPFIVLEFMERGSVRRELDTEYLNKLMPIHLQVKYALDAARGMNYLHKQGRMHRDLKCDNLLIDNRGVVKVADLGCTKIVPQVMDNGLKRVGPVRGTKGVGTSFFRAPEIVLGREYDLSVDVYSYGIALWEIQTAKHPYWEHTQLGLSSSEILNQIVSNELRPEFAFAGDKQMKELTELCWSASPYRRPTFDGVVLKLEAICYQHEIGKMSVLNFLSITFLNF